MVYVSDVSGATTLYVLPISEAPLESMLVVGRLETTIPTTNNSI